MRRTEEEKRGGEDEDWEEEDESRTEDNINKDIQVPTSIE